ncbi:hypothetical protein UZ36_03850 [Candidatus Nitromaritima sp. SCGC AAA799-C22]|nr:hypothetical protein UZ36_03850 [Candidatus Nitromaritima sp. SCGC AAA799-C22]
MHFKKNIYQADPEPFDEENPEPRFDPYNFILQTLITDRNIFIGLQRLDPGEAAERFQPLFPHASRYGGVDILNSISKRLLEGIVQPDTWYQMNAYHLCYLYDSLAGVAGDYSYSGLEQRLTMYPELMGADIDFDDFLNEYIFNTAFLIDPDRFNNMDAKDKRQRGFVDPCLFGVINRLIPSDEEIKLTVLEENPFDAETEEI